MPSGGTGHSCGGRSGIWRARWASTSSSTSRPVALVLVAIMHFIPDADEPRRIVGRYVDALAPGSYLVLSHASVLSADPDTAEAVRKYASSSAGAFIIRTPDEVAALFDGLDLLEPGLVDAGLWRTTRAEPLERGFLAGVGRKRLSRPEQRLSAHRPIGGETIKGESRAPIARRSTLSWSRRCRIRAASRAPTRRRSTRSW